MMTTRRRRTQPEPITATLTSPEDISQVRDDLTDLIRECLSDFSEYLERTDEGIGSYEFWGQKGFDSRPGVEMEDPVPDIEIDVTSVHGNPDLDEDAYPHQVKKDVEGGGDDEHEPDMQGTVVAKLTKTTEREGKTLLIYEVELE